MTTILLPTMTPARGGLVLACKDCLKEFRSSELVEQRCIGCRVHRHCAEVCAELAAYLKKQLRYRRANARVNPEQLDRLKRRLIKRVQELTPGPQLGMQLVEKEFQSVLSSHGVIFSGGVLEVVQARDLLK